MTIQNVFVLMLENHSFDNIFAMSGIPGIIAASTADSNAWLGTVYNVHNGAPGSMPTDPGHEFPDVLEQLAGTGATYPSGGPYPPIDRSGFAANYATSTTEGPVPTPGQIGDIMACFATQTQLPVLYQLATSFAVCDQWFSSIPGPTWPNRFFVHGASSGGLDHSPTPTEIAKWTTVGGFTYPNGSIYDSLNQAGIQWRLYQDHNGPTVGTIPQVGALKGVFVTQVHDVANLASDLNGSYPYAYTFIEPNYGDVTSGSYQGGSSQHPMDGVNQGENLIADVYEAIRNSPLWNTSLLIITYDEHGGFYDSVPPGAIAAPADGSSNTLNENGFAFDQAGVRVPAIVISPLIPANTVDHTAYDHSSVLATLESLFGVAPLTGRDRDAQNVLNLLSLQVARTDCPTSLARPAAPVAIAPEIVTPERRARDLEPLPEAGNLLGFLAIAHKTELELAARKTKLRSAAREQFKTIQTRGQARAYIDLVRQKIEAAKALGTTPKADAGARKSKKRGAGAGRSRVKRSGARRRQRPKRR
jgi:phospholipase C